MLARPLSILYCQSIQSYSWAKGMSFQTERIPALSEKYGICVTIITTKYKKDKHQHQMYLHRFAPIRVTGPKINTTWLYEALAEKWIGCLPEEAHNSFKERGEYSLLVRPGLRVIVLNNNIAYRFNW